MSFLVISKISKAFFGSKVVDSVDLNIERSEFFSLLGPSGCGKTTLLRMIAGLETPDSGEIRIDGESMSNVAPWERPTNMVFQSYAIFPHLNVFDNIAYGLRKLRLSKNSLHNEVESMLATVRLEGLANRSVDQLSGGQRQRVALARALIRKPKLLLLDEPLAALDKRLREAMQLELRSLQRKIGITFLLVTHDQEEALSLSDRIAVMDAGKILQTATPRELYMRPRSREVADFIGEMNFFPATVDEVSGEGVIVDAGPFGALTLLRANVQHPVNRGDRIFLAIRPEHIGLAGAGTMAKIVASTFRGERNHLYVSVPGHETPIAVSGDIPSTDHTVQLVFPPQFLIAIPVGG